MSKNMNFTYPSLISTRKTWHTEGSYISDVIIGAILYFLYYLLREIFITSVIPVKQAKWKMRELMHITRQKDTIVIVTVKEQSNSRLMRYQAFKIKALKASHLVGFETSDPPITTLLVSQKALVKELQHNSVDITRLDGSVPMKQACISNRTSDVILIIRLKNHVR
ncbi:hypothetical protein F5884DRAFT_890541 [Xylogone sp. PMI_703]|nr:hypothetical protein F5884DRAFT_890541 [Xylogone sp. PMI_703]